MKEFNPYTPAPSEEIARLWSLVTALGDGPASNALVDLIMRYQVIFNELSFIQQMKNEPMHRVSNVVYSTREEMYEVRDMIKARDMAGLDAWVKKVSL